MRVVFHPAAHEELIQSARFYDSRSEGLGAYFLNAVERAVARIQLFPETGVIETSQIHRRPIRGFPFTILYELQTDRIYIAAIMHQHRNSGYWRERVE